MTLMLSWFKAVFLAICVRLLLHFALLEIIGFSKISYFISEKLLIVSGMEKRT